MALSPKLNWALAGAQPLFPRPLTTGQLANRDPQRFMDLARASFERRSNSHPGPLVLALEAQLCQLHGTRHCVSFANACFALMLLLRQVARRGASDVLLPALTFRGLPHLVRWAGLEPCYGDVDGLSHTLTPASLAAWLGANSAAVLAVDNVHALCDIDKLEQISNQAGVPLVLDCVYALGGHYGRGAVGSRGLASVFSLHATKLINGFEGGYLTTNDASLAGLLRRQRDGGEDGAGPGPEGGLDARLNEIHAAMALSNLPHRAAIVADNAARLAAYQGLFRDLPWVSFANDPQTQGNHGLVLLKVAPTAPCSRDELVRLLRAENALVRPYYPQPLHRMLPVAGRRTQPDLPVADELAQSFVQMPVGDRVAVSDIERLRGFFDSLDRHADAIVGALRSSTP